MKLVKIDSKMIGVVIASFKKDVWPMKLMQYGTIQFPHGENDGMWLYPVAVKGKDGTAIKMEKMYEVYGKYNSDPYEKLEFDLMYINDMSILTDLELMFATVGILFSSESTAGVAEGAVTAMSYDSVNDIRSGA